MVHWMKLHWSRRSNTKLVYTQHEVMCYNLSKMNQLLNPWGNVFIQRKFREPTLTVYSKMASCLMCCMSSPSLVNSSVAVAWYWVFTRRIVLRSQRGVQTRTCCILWDSFVAIARLSYIAHAHPQTGKGRYPHTPYTVIWKMFVIKLFLWGRRTTKINHLSMCLQ